MIIQQSRTQLQASCLHQVSRTTQQTVRAWVGRPPESTVGQAGQLGGQAGQLGGQAGQLGGQAGQLGGQAVQLGGQAGQLGGQAVQLGGQAGQLGGQMAARPAAESPADNGAVPGRLATVVALVEWLTGQEVQVFDPAELNGRAGAAGHHTAHPAPADPPTTAARAGWGLDVTTTRTTVEREATAVAAVASVVTADGRRLDVSLDLRLNRQEIHSETSRLVAGDAAVTDPLLLGFGGAAGLDSTTTAFDLNGDGTPERLPDAGVSSGYLVLDRNGNGVLDDAGELFGPSTGDGFAELSAYDEDGNGWIDEADPIYTRLGLARSGQGAVTPLAERGVGAIGLARIASPFTFSNGEQFAGMLRSTGIWIGEDGTAGAVQQIDVAG